MLLTDKVAVITGSVRGTGAGIARVFAREGAQVVINQVQDEGKPKQVLEEIQAAGGQVLFVKADITDEIQVQDLVRQAKSNSARLTSWSAIMPVACRTKTFKTRHGPNGSINLIPR